MKKSAKKLVLHKETLRQLEDPALRVAGGVELVAVATGGVFEWGCSVVSCLTCGRNSCLTACTLNCGGIGGCGVQVANPGLVDGGEAVRN